ncbi:hypothetical protein BK655_21875 [Pseudomonas brassicacearum]|nr:hypothetical protein BK655_21875 [Pseudomonas brassicacearum]
MVYALAVATRSIGEGGDCFVSASRSSGSKLPRHRFFSYHRFFLVPRFFLTMGLGIWGRFATQRG